jgi:hypothetical protein
MRVEFTEQVPGSDVVSHVAKDMPEAPHVGDVVPVFIEGRLTRCRVVGREWADPTAAGLLVCRVAQIFEPETEEPIDGKTQAP